MIKRILLMLVILGLFTMCFHNSNDEKTTGTGSETENAIVSGYLYTEAGDPSANTKVRFIPVGFNSNTGAMAKRTEADTLSTTTNDNGWYGADDLVPDTYNVYGEATDGNLSLINSVVITEDTLVIEPDTVKAPGSLTGFIKLREGHSATKVQIIVRGSIRPIDFGNEDASFNLSNLAEGEYAVRFFSSDDIYGNLDTTFTIIAGETLVISDSIVMPLLIPIPTNFTLMYDTLKQMVNLSWDKMDEEKVSGYMVSRQIEGEAVVELTAVAIMDTFFVDSSAVQDETYEYSVASVGASEKIGEKGVELAVTIKSKFKLIATYGKGRGTENGFFTAIRSVAVDNDGNIYSADDDNHRIQKFDSTGNFLLAWGTQGSNEGEFNRPWDIGIDSANFIYVVDSKNDRIQKFDSDGNFVLQWGGFQSPYDIDINNGHVFVGERQGRKIQKFDLLGNLLFNIPIENGVNSVAANDSLIFVIEGDSRILKYNALGVLIDTIFVTGKRENNIDIIQMNSLSLYENELCISLLTEAKIQCIDFSGSITKKWTLSNYPTIHSPQDVFVYKNTYIFVAVSDYIQKYGQ